MRSIYRIGSGSSKLTRFLHLVELRVWWLFLALCALFSLACSSGISFDKLKQVP